MRVAVLDADKCQPRKCAKECIKFCPGVRMGEETIVFEDGKPRISEELCTGCGICVKKCPFQAISVVGLPDELKEGLIHQYGENAFRLFYLPYPRENAVTGLIGENGIGKTTIVRIFSGEIIPNLGKLGSENKEAVLEYFSGTQFYDYFKELYDGKIKAVHKPQYVDYLPKVVKGKVKQLLERVDERNMLGEIATKLELENTLKRDIKEISGGELQRVAIAGAILREGDIYIFDEPSSYLDVKQRLNVAKIIRELARENRVLVVEHDLVVLDYLADYINILYGKVGAYGIVSHPRSVREGINVYLEGYLKEENIRFRREPIKFEVRPPSPGWENKPFIKFKNLKKSLGEFSIEIEGGEINQGEVIGILGPNAIGKTTFVKMLAGVIKQDAGEIEYISNTKAKVSYKPQYIKPEGDRSVEEVMRKVYSPFFEREILKPLELEQLYHKNVQELSGGELQRVAIALCLGREAEIYLLDEPSAYLDVEQRLKVAKIIRRTMEKREAVGIVVDHDILFVDYISDRLMVFYGKPGKEGKATKPLSMKEGMNRFLKDIDITFRRDPETGRPRANKPGSTKDREQKAKGEYYYV
ncbi:MAG: ribosome biogenesis/translation initiation ATPase RLI [Candidatus Hydrothermarchaeota archaeon]|nr:MAG: ribosome biogenesis/translation initiation ATPase RLI [Candidatus Hydrothermarchaeota archaeon]